jgi:hypothetical protein
LGEHATAVLAAGRGKSEQRENGRMSQPSRRDMLIRVGVYLLEFDSVRKGRPKQLSVTMLVDFANGRVLSSVSLLPDP